MRFVDIVFVCWPRLYIVDEEAAIYAQQMLTYANNQAERMDGYEVSKSIKMASIGPGIQKQQVSFVPRHHSGNR